MLTLFLGGYKSGGGDNPKQTLLTPLTRARLQRGPAELGKLVALRLLQLHLDCFRTYQILLPPLFQRQQNERPVLGFANAVEILGFVDFSTPSQREEEINEQQATLFSPGNRSVNVLMESKGGKKSRSSSLLQYEAPLGYSIEDIRPAGGIKKFQSAAYSNCARKPS